MNRLRTHGHAQRIDQETGEIQKQDQPKRPRKPSKPQSVQDAVEAPAQEPQAAVQQTAHQPAQDLLGDVPEITWAQVVDQINTASDMDELDAARDLIQHLPDTTMQAELHQKAAQRLVFLNGETA